MCSNCSGDYENPEATANIQLCPDCNHDVELHDSLGCQVRSSSFRCKCKRTIEELLFGRGIGAKLIEAQERTATAIMQQCEIAARGIAEWLQKFGRHPINTETLRCVDCGAAMCRKCGGCEKQCGGRHG